MGLRSWWIETQLNRLESKVRRLRYFQKKNREKEHKLDAEEKKGMVPGAYEARKAKLDAEREQLTRRINTLLADEERLKAELALAKNGDNTTA